MFTSCPVLHVCRLFPVKVCSHHHKYLSTQCPSCNQKLPLLCSNLRSGYCPQCDRWLGIKPDSSTESNIKSENREWHLWVAKTIGELFTIAPTLSSVPARSTIAHSFCQYIQQATEGCHGTNLALIDINLVQKKLLPLSGS